MLTPCAQVLFTFRCQGVLTGARIDCIFTMIPQTHALTEFARPARVASFDQVSNNTVAQCNITFAECFCPS
jgi:hypothetical protein